MSRSCCTAYSCCRASTCGKRIAATGQFFFQRTLGSKFIFSRKRNFSITIQLREEAHTLVHRSHQNWILLLLWSLSSYNSSPCCNLARYHQRLTKHVDAVILHEPSWVQYRDQDITVHINTHWGLESYKLKPGNKISRDITFDRCSELKTRCACFRNKCEQKSNTSFTIPSVLTSFQMRQNYTSMSKQKLLGAVHSFENWGMQIPRKGRSAFVQAFSGYIILHLKSIHQIWVLADQPSYIIYCMELTQNNTGLFINTLSSHCQPSFSNHFTNTCSYFNSIIQGRVAPGVGNLQRKRVI
jgi:hypothetical protein